MTIVTQMTLQMLKAMLERNLRLQGILWNTSTLQGHHQQYVVLYIMLLGEDKEG